MNSSPDRRQFAKVALAGTAALASLGKGSATLRPIPPGVKIGTSAGAATVYAAGHAS